MDKSLFFGTALSLFLFVTPALAQEGPEIPPDGSRNPCAGLVEDVTALLFRDSKARDEAHYELFFMKGASIESVNLQTNDSLLIIHGAEDLRRSTVRNLQRLGYVFEQLSPEELATIPRRTPKSLPVAAMTGPNASSQIASEPEAQAEPMKFRSRKKSNPPEHKLVWLRDQSQSAAAQVQALAEQLDFSVLSYKPGLRQTATSQIEVLQIQIKMAPEAAGTIPRAAGFISLQPI